MNRKDESMTKFDYKAAFNFIREKVIKENSADLDARRELDRTLDRLQDRLDTMDPERRQRLLELTHLDCAVSYEKTLSLGSALTV